MNIFLEKYQKIGPFSHRFFIKCSCFFRTPFQRPFLEGPSARLSPKVRFWSDFRFSWDPKIDPWADIFGPKGGNYDPECRRSLGSRKKWTPNDWAPLLAVPSIFTDFGHIFVPGHSVAVGMEFFDQKKPSTRQAGSNKVSFIHICPVV